MGFKFAERNIINIEIEDKVYPVQYNQRLVKNILAISEEAQKASGSIKENDIESINNACNIVKKGIDSILGENASKEIFKDRQQDLMETIDVIMYIFDEINRFKNNKLQEIQNKAPQKNRQQKRHDKRRK